MSGPRTEAARDLIAAFDGFIAAGVAKGLDMHVEAVIGEKVKATLLDVEEEATVIERARIRVLERAIPTDPFIAEVEYKSWCYACDARGATPKWGPAEPHKPTCAWAIATARVTVEIRNEDVTRT